MFTTSKEVEFDAGHRVPFHASKCRQLHGHRYRVRATVTAEDVARINPDDPRSGMVLDFGEIKQALTVMVHDKYDHKLILWKHDELIASEQFSLLRDSYGIVVVDCIPTAEELARVFFRDTNEYLQTNCAPFRSGVAWLAAIDVWETPTSIATYSVR